MKKFFLTLAVLFVAVSASAQGWGVGGRIGSGLQAVGEYKFENGNYIDARFGMGWSFGGVISADFTALYQWNVCNMDWTPSAGNWSLDAGVGANVGGGAGWVYCGVAGGVKLGFTFKNTPIKLAVDWTPSVGPVIVYGGGIDGIAYNPYALANCGVSCVYYF
jgi:hypothetical protein